CWMNLQVRQHRAPPPLIPFTRSGLFEFRAENYLASREDARVAAVPGRATRYSCTSCRWAWAKTACVGKREGLLPKIFPSYSPRLREPRDPVGGGRHVGSKRTAANSGVSPFCDESRGDN